MEVKKGQVKGRIDFSMWDEPHFLMIGHGLISHIDKDRPEDDYELVEHEGLIRLKLSKIEKLTGFQEKNGVLIKVYGNEKWDRHRLDSNLPSMIRYVEKYNPSKLVVVIFSDVTNDIQQTLRRWLDIYVKEVLIYDALRVEELINKNVIKSSFTFQTTEHINNAFPVSKYFQPQEAVFSSDSDKIFFNTDKIARIFSEIIVKSTSRKASNTSQEERFYGIFGQWGRGKTYFWNLIKKHLDTEYVGKYKIIPFHAWRYQDTPSIWAYLYETFADEYYGKPKTLINWGLITDVFKSLKLSIIRDVKQFIIFLLGILGVILSWIYNEGVLWKDFSGGEVGVLISGAITVLGAYLSFTKPLVTRAKNFIKAHGSRTNMKMHLGIQHEIQVELKNLLKAWDYFSKDKKTFVLFIDDIDRCDENKVVLIVDSLRVMLNEPDIQKRLIVIAAIDERILSQAIRKKYQAFINTGHTEFNADQLSAEYLDKLFIAGIKLDPLSENQKKEILMGITEDITDSDLDEVKSSKEMSEINDTDDHDLDYDDNGSEKDEENSEPMASPPPESRFVQSVINNQLHPKEREILEENVINIRNATPRSIRGFTIKYRLARNILEVQLPEGSSAFEKWHEDFEAKRKLIEGIVKIMNFEKSDETEFDPELKDICHQVVDMVNYYSLEVKSDKPDNVKESKQK